MKKLMLVSLVALTLITLIFTACSTPSVPAPAPTTTAKQNPPATSGTPAASSPAAAAGSAADFFKNNTVTLICPMAAGAGSDYAARLVASYWTDATGGGAMIVKNITGGSGMVGTNNIAVAKPDGLTLGMGMLTTSYLGPMIFKDPAFKVDSLKQTWLGGVFEEPNLIAITTGLPYKTAKDLQDAKTLKFGAVGPNSASSVGDALLAEFLGLTNFKMITGYSGGSAVVLGMGKKEIDGFVSPMTTIISALDKGFANKPPFAIIADKRMELYPDTPTLRELTTMTPEKEELLKTSEALLSSCRVFCGPPDIPADRVKYLQDTFKAITAMKPFQDQAKFYFPLWTEPMSGDQVLQFIKSTQNMQYDKIKNIISKYMSIN